jgi:hypothetical protein
MIFFDKSKTLDREDQARVLALYKSGHSVSEISKMFDVSVSPIRRILIANEALRTRAQGIAIASARGVFKASAKRGENSHRWRGGKSKSYGYVLVRNPFHDPSMRGAVDKGYYIPEHRLVWMQVNGEIPPGFEVHHINGVKDDNRLENLMIMEKAAHAKSHMGAGNARHNERCAQRPREKIAILQARIRELEKQLDAAKRGMIENEHCD